MKVVFLCIGEDGENGKEGFGERAGEHGSFGVDPVHSRGEDEDRR